MAGGDCNRGCRAEGTGTGVRAMATETSLEILRDLLLMVDAEFPRLLPTMEEMQAWDRATRDAVARWAAAVYLRASDHPVRVPPMPDALKSVNNTVK